MQNHLQRQFTAGAERVLDEAARWSGCSDSTHFGAPSLLLGLLAEGECRAAILLAEHGITAAAVKRRWPHLVRSDAPLPPVGFDEDVQESLSAVVACLGEDPRSMVLATEHLLLGLVLCDHETGGWIRQNGVDPDTLEMEIHRQYGPSAGPAPPEQMPPLPISSKMGDHTQPEKGASGLLAAKTASSAPRRAGAAERVRVLRVLDAAANRGREGLRVVEDYVRFGLDDRHLTEQLKTFRHELTALVKRIPLGDRLAARETQADVGATLWTDAERRREDAAGVLAANFTRLQESLRSLEEFGKLIDPSLAGQFEALRYRSYTFQRAAEITAASGDRLADARLYVLIDGRKTAEEFEELAATLVEAGVDVIQLRDKWLDDRQLYERARLLRQITRRGRTLFIMNDRPDVAALVHADGVHVGQEELSVKDARTIVGPEVLVGVSTHSIEQARRAVLDGADYIGVGPVFPSETKEFDQLPGLPLLRAVAEEIRLPAFAIGGITPKNLPQVLAAGFTRIAVSRAVAAATDPAAVARAFFASLR